MADRKKAKRKRIAGNADESTPKAFMKIAKYLRFNLPSKKAMLAGMKVDYFLGNKAVSFLMKSKWSVSAAGETALFHTRADCVSFMQSLIDKDMIHRAYKIYKKLDEDENGESRRLKGNGENEPETAPADKDPDTLKNKNLSETSKGKRKYKLGMHDDQTYVDEAEVYVWVYDPPTVKQFLIGSLFLAVVIICSLFPLWPSSFRSVAFYFSAASGVFIGVIMFLAVLKYILFIIIWSVTRGKIHFWFLPNLSEDVGFIESFIPVYVVKRYPSTPKKQLVTAVEPVLIDQNVETDYVGEDDHKADNPPKNVSDEAERINDEYELVSHVDIGTEGDDSEHCKKD